MELACTGLNRSLEKRKSASILCKTGNDDGSIQFFFLCCDLTYQYMGKYFTKFDESNFHPVRNNVRNGDRL